MYLLKCLKSQGLPAKQLHIILCAIIVSRILYALPAWGGYLPASLVSRIDALLRKAVRFGYASQIQQLADLLSDADEQQCLPKWEIVTTAFISCYTLYQEYTYAAQGLSMPI